MRRFQKKLQSARKNRNRSHTGSVGKAKETGYVSKPPPSTPHSDIDGIHQDEERNVDSANRAGQDSSDLQKAREDSAARPPYTDDQPEREDRSR